MGDKTETYPRVNFRFRASFYLNPDSQHDMGFQSVTGLDATVETEMINEGGVNHYAHVVPTRKKYGPMVLKRGILTPQKSALRKYFKDCFDNEVFTVLPTVLIDLLDGTGTVIMHWKASNAWPLSWKFSELNAMQGELLIETLELNYNQLIFDTP